MLEKLSDGRRHALDLGVCEFRVNGKTKAFPSGFFGNRKIFGFVA